MVSSSSSSSSSSLSGANPSNPDRLHWIATAGESENGTGESGASGGGDVSRQSITGGRNVS